jgi:hypothetical protein
MMITTAIVFVYLIPDQRLPVRAYRGAESRFYLKQEHKKGHAKNYMAFLANK